MSAIQTSCCIAQIWAVLSHSSVSTASNTLRSLTLNNCANFTIINASFQQEKRSMLTRCGCFKRQKTRYEKLWWIVRNGHCTSYFVQRFCYQYNSDWGLDDMMALKEQQHELHHVFAAHEAWREFHSASWSVLKSYTSDWSSWDVGRYSATLSESTSAF